MIHTHKPLFTLLATFFVAMGLLISCETPINQAEEKAVFAKQDLEQTERDSIADYQNFKAESEAIVVKNNHLIANFKVEIMTGKVSMKARYQKRLAELEKQNKKMGIKLKQYTETSEEDWEMFKRKWNEEMGRIVESLDEMTKSNN
jgi:hypothetical protein